MILNGRRASSSINELTKLVSFPVYQEPQNKRFWEDLNGKKDDILVYDNCGRLSSHVRMPKSDLSFPFVWNSIVIAIKKQVCGKCTLMRPTNTTTTTTTAETTLKTTRPVTIATAATARKALKTERPVTVATTTTTTARTTAAKNPRKQRKRNSKPKG